MEKINDPESRVILDDLKELLKKGQDKLTDEEKKYCEESLRRIQLNIGTALVEKYPDKFELAKNGLLIIKPRMHYELRE